VHGDYLRYLVLGDITILIEESDGLRIVTDDRVNATAAAERATADALPAGSPEKAEALVRMKHAEQAVRNVPGGYWVAAADPDVARNALTGELLAKTVRQIVVMSDGATRAISTFKIYDWPELLRAIVSTGPGELIKQVRVAENADAVGIGHPRNKIHDDATVAMIQL
jgi:hypothetical protein